MKGRLALIFLFIISLAREASAAPIVQNLTILPSSSLWLGESASISVNCYDPNASISKANLMLTKPNGETYLFPLDYIEGKWKITLDSLDKLGKYTFNLTCTNNKSEENFTQNYFQISDLSTFLTLEPRFFYLGDTSEIKIYFKILKNDGSEVLTIRPNQLNLNFTLKINGQETEIKSFGWSSEAWILLINAPTSDGKYEVEVSTNYERKELKNSASLEVRKPIEFNFIDVKPFWVRPKDKLDLNLEIKERGVPLTSVDPAWFNFKVDDVEAEVINFSSSGNLIRAQILAPELSTGSHKLKVKFNYNGNYFAEKEISYVISISGNLKSEGILKFISNSFENTIATAKDGSYSGILLPGIYSIEITFPESKLYLSGVNVQDFDDAIKYYHLLDFEVEGIRSAGTFVYEVALPFSSALIEMRYDASKILDEDKLEVYKCENWNSGRNICNSGWKLIEAKIDQVKDLVKVNTTTLSAFVVGERKKLVLEFNLDKESYSLKEPITIQGIVYDELKQRIGGVKIKAQILNTLISKAESADKNGLFILDLISPENEGNYELLLSAFGDNYLPFNQTSQLIVRKSKQLSLLIPDSIRVEAGKNVTAQLSILNTGQTDFSNLSLSIKGVPEQYFSVQKEIEFLKAGDEKIILASFFFPSDFDQQSFTAKFAVESKDISAEKTFALTVLQANNTFFSPNVVFPTLTFPAGLFSLPSLPFDLVYLLSLACISFSIAIYLKRRKLRNLERSNIKNLLFDIKREIERINKPKNPEKNPESLLKDLDKIISEGVNGRT